MKCCGPYLGKIHSQSNSNYNGWIETLSIVGQSLPDVELGFMQGETCVNKKLSEIIGMDRAFLIGVPQAFTPICTNNHLPVIIQNFDGFIKSNFKHVCIISPDNPWVLKEWKQRLGAPSGLKFLADRNLDFINSIGLSTTCEELQLGQCSMRYALQVENFKIFHEAVEASIFDVTCTAGLSAWIDFSPLSWPWIIRAQKAALQRLASVRRQTYFKNVSSENLRLTGEEQFPYGWLGLYFWAVTFTQ